MYTRTPRRMLIQPLAERKEYQMGSAKNTMLLSSQRHLTNHGALGDHGNVDEASPVAARE